MEFEWDDAKHARNLRERGISFVDGTRIFGGRFVEQIDDRRDYGEVRMCAIGECAGTVLTVIYTLRGEARRIISVRLANRRERLQWQRRE